MMSLQIRHSPEYLFTLYTQKSSMIYEAYKFLKGFQWQYFDEQLNTYHYYLNRMFPCMYC